MTFAISGGTSATFTLALYGSGGTAAPRRSEAERTERDGCERHRGCEPRGRSGTPLADAMAQALGSVGWTPRSNVSAPAPAPADGAPATSPPAAADPAAEDAGGGATDLPAALAAFAEALMGMLREAGGSGRARGRERGDDDGERRAGGDFDSGRRAWGYGRAVGVLSVRLERVIDTLNAEPAVASPAPAPPPAVLAVPAPAPVAQTNPVEPPAAPETVAEPTPTETPIDTRPDLPAAEPTPLADAFRQLLDALRADGADVPNNRTPSSLMIDFLQALSDGLRPAGNSGSGGAGGISFTGLFIRISA